MAGLTAIKETKLSSVLYNQVAPEPLQVWATTMMKCNKRGN